MGETLVVNIHGGEHRWGEIDIIPLFKWPKINGVTMGVK